MIGHRDAGSDGDSLRAPSDEPALPPPIESKFQRMTLDQRIGQLNLVNPGDLPLTGSISNQNVRAAVLAGRVGMMFGTRSLAARREIQQLCVDQSPHGIPMLFASDVVHGYRTALPLPIAMACSWDLDLIERAAHVAATEARADGIDLTFAPMVDVSRDPRWGRVAEGPGESVTLACWISAASVRGFQGRGDGSQLADADRMLACVKHFAGYGAAEGGREYAAVNLGPNELHATHLPPFRAAVDAGVAALMPGFHTIDRVPVSSDCRLLTRLLRGRWGFGGVVISDYTAIQELQSHGLGDESAVAAIALRAGIDVDMVSESYVRTLAVAVATGRIAGWRIDQACRRVLRLKWLAGLFDDPFRSLDQSRATRVIGCAEHRGAARRMAAASCVLLKNHHRTLPLKPGSRIALVGPLAEDRANLAGTWSVSADAGDSVSLLEGLRQLLAESEIKTARGCHLADDPLVVERLNVFGETVTPDPRPLEELIDEAVSIAGRADVVVVTVGEAKEHAGECSSRTELSLADSQVRLITALGKLDRPLVLVVFGGRPLVLTDVIDHADAVVMAWYGGSLAGPGIADVLCGQQEPTARLAISFPRRVGQIPTHHDALPTGRPLPPGTDFEKFKSCYLDEVNQPLFPFGYGLAYTEFAFGPPQVDRGEITRGESLTVSVLVENIGDRVGTAVVQLYLRSLTAAISRPLLELKAFERLTLPPGHSKIATLTLDADAFAVGIARTVDDDERRLDPGEFLIATGPHAAELQTVAVKVV